MGFFRDYTATTCALRYDCANNNNIRRSLGQYKRNIFAEKLLIRLLAVEKVISKKKKSDNESDNSFSSCCFCGGASISG